MGCGCGKQETKIEKELPRKPAEEEHLTSPDPPKKIDMCKEPIIEEKKEVQKSPQCNLEEIQIEIKKEKQEMAIEAKKEEKKVQIELRKEENKSAVKTEKEIETKNIVEVPYEKARIPSVVEPPPKHTFNLKEPDTKFQLLYFSSKNCIKTPFSSATDWNNIIKRRAEMSDTLQSILLLPNRQWYQEYLDSLYGKS